MRWHSNQLGHISGGCAFLLVIILKVINNYILVLLVPCYNRVLPHGFLFNSCLRRCIDFRESTCSEGRERERDIDVTEKHQSARDWTHNLGMCPYWQVNLQLFGIWDNAPTNWTTCPGSGTWFCCLRKELCFSDLGQWAIKGEQTINDTWMTREWHGQTKWRSAGRACCTRKDCPSSRGGMWWAGWVLIQPKVAGTCQNPENTGFSS